MKLLLYSHFFAPSIGGVETIVEAIARGLAARSGAANNLLFDVALVTQTPAVGFDDSNLPFAVVRRPGLFGLLRLIRRADVVHLAGPSLLPLLLGLLLQKAVVIEHHGFHTVCPNGQLFFEPAQTPCPGHFMAAHHTACIRCASQHGALGGLKLWALTFVRRILCRFASANIAPTDFLANVLHLPRSVTVVHGLPPRDLPPRDTSGGVPVIVFQGRLVTTKGVRVLLEAARRLQERSLSFELKIIGDGPERQPLAQLCAEWNLASRVHFLGPLPSAAVESVLAQASVVVVPSLGGEVFGLVAAENMLRGLPVVASDLGAFREVLGDAGVTFRTGDAQDLARCLERLLRDYSLAASLGGLARRRILDSFSFQRMIDGHAKLYGELRGAPRP